MNIYPREFPPDRRNRPKRRAERRVFEALAGSDRRGFVFYEWRKGYERIELDFAVWIEGLGRFALQVKGGHYLLVDAEWRLKTREGYRPVKSCPLDETKLATLDLHDDIKTGAGAAYNPFVIPVLVFPDMEPNAAIGSLAGRKGVYLVWGTANLVVDLENIVKRRSVKDRLSWDRIADEVRAVTDELIDPGVVTDAARIKPAPDESVSLSPAGFPGETRLAVFGRNVLTIRFGAAKPAG